MLTKKKNFIKKLIYNYKRGKNINLYLKKKMISKEAKIEVSYDLQSGSYLQLVKKDKSKYYDLAKEISLKISKHFKNYKTFLDCGCGELSFSNLIKKINKRKIQNYYGFDLSLKRLATGIQYFKWKTQTNKIFVAKLDEIPLPNNSIDVVFTNHALEPNGGKEKKIILELLRVSKKGVVLNEPFFQNANIEQKKRMQKLGYVKINSNLIRGLKYKYKILDLNNQINKNNKTKLILIFKNKKKNFKKPNLVDPKFKTQLVKKYGHFYSNETKFIYPIVKNIPILIDDKKILQS